MTHHGSPSIANNDLLQSVENNTEVDEFAKTAVGAKCHFCHMEVSDFVRNDFLNERQSPKSKVINSDFQPP